MDVPFESFAKLIYRLGNPPKSSKTNKPIAPEKILSSWLNHLAKPLPNHTGKHIFRLLFPHEGARRRYGLKETKLAIELERVLAIDGLARWDSVSWDRGGEAGTGCLGREVEIAMKQRGSGSTPSTLTIGEVDSLLDELAAASPFSQLSQQPISCRPTSTLLSILFRESKLSPYALAVLCQIILRDLRPLLNPLPRLPIRNPTAMLRLKSTTGPAQLSLREAIRAWDDNMWRLYVGGKGDLDWCTDTAEAMANGHEAEDLADGPVVGVNVKIPKCRKGRSIEDALKAFTTEQGSPCKTVWAETKYDGYRMQIHVDLVGDGHPRITIFSKSMRDSTQDRINTHGIILASLGLPVNPGLPVHPALPRRNSLVRSGRRVMERSTILEAEVVPYNESNRDGGRGPGIEEFWHLGSAGVTIEPNFGHSSDTSWKRNNRHLCLVFFDILHLDGDNLLHMRYDDRRRILERVIRVIPGFSQIAERSVIPLNLGYHSALDALKQAFQQSNDRREEGLVLKAAESTYCQMRWPWVKLKKDYIPNVGDCIDLVLLGAGWDVDRARELRVDTSVFTTFYIGTLTNGSQVKSRRELPHFEILFRVSYGLDRDQLEVYNGYIRHGRWGSKPFDKDDPFKRRLLGLSWTYTLHKGIQPPSVLFEQPLCAEVMGAGFQKLPLSHLYELRWPRLQKVYDERDRPWTEALNSNDLVHTAHQSLGYDNVTCLSPRSLESDSINAAWRSSSSGILVDIPELISPPSAKRTRSAPDIMKTSPKSLSPSGIGIRSKRLVGRGILESGRRLMDILCTNKGQVENCAPTQDLIANRNREEALEHFKRPHKSISEDQKDENVRIGLGGINLGMVPYKRRKLDFRGKALSLRSRIKLYKRSIASSTSLYVQVTA